MKGKEMKEETNWEIVEVGESARYNLLYTYVPGFDEDPI